MLEAAATAFSRTGGSYFAEPLAAAMEAYADTHGAQLLKYLKHMWSLPQVCLYNELVNQQS